MGRRVGVHFGSDANHIFAMVRFRFVLVVRGPLLKVEQYLPLDSFTDDEVEVALVVSVDRNGNTVRRRDLDNTFFDVYSGINELDCFVKTVDWAIGVDAGAPWVSVIGGELVHSFRILFSRRLHCVMVRNTEAKKGSNLVGL